MVLIGNGWDEALEPEFNKEYFIRLLATLDNEYATKTIYPPREKIFQAFSAVNYLDVRVVILGQDPYHGEGEANGLAFSVSDGLPLPRSLRNIYKELNSDLAKPVPSSGDLMRWARQGVLLLNTVLTVQKDRANSHAGIGWKRFADAVILSLNSAPSPIVYILWGDKAIKKSKLISSRHYILSSPHPSPLSARLGFFGSKPFSKANQILANLNLPQIDW